MQKYKVRLKEKHTAKEDQVVQGYLGSTFDQMIMTYTRGEAIKKAKMFNGTIEKHETKYKVEDFLKVAQIPFENVPSPVIEALHSKHDEPIAYLDYDISIGEGMYYVSAILEVAQKETNENIKAELLELYQEVEYYNYVIFTKI